MASNPAALLQQYGAKIVLPSLEQVAGQSAAVLHDDAAYRRLVVDPGWELIPAPMRLIGRDRLRWDEMFSELRREVFDQSEGRIGIRSDAPKRLIGLINKLFDIRLKQDLDPDSSSSQKVFAS